MAGHVADLICL